MACDGECNSGKFGCGCCCASVTNIKGGIHPDAIESVSRDLVLTETSATQSRSHRSEILLGQPAHIVGFNVSLVTVRRDEDALDAPNQVLEPGSGGVGNLVSAAPASVSLYTIAGFVSGDLAKGGFNPNNSYEQNRNYFATCSLTARTPTYDSPDDLFGYFADGGLFVELNAPSTQYGVRVVVRYVPRLQFSPAYHDPVEVLQHYWKCSRDDTEFLDGFYGGTVIDVPSSDEGGNPSRTTPPQTSGGGSFGSQTSVIPETSWFTFD